LQPVLVPERLLQGVEVAHAPDSLDGRDPVTFGLERQHGTALHGAAIHQDGTGAALAGVAADMSSGEVQVVPQDVHQQRPRLHLDVMLRAVDGKGDGTGHETVAPSNRGGRGRGDLRGDGARF
jgi:hypothetical protein